ncbi:hypothetical protein [Crocinitomix catalasitica]|uniref:hypothetical protein n=1 Tax=Crocinitomix catalasitica TaxID=184607 RepID=UPI0004848085|nr:hypothetical protein [Crocinitomix catalasitica]
MNTILKYLIFIPVILIGLSACKKDEPKSIVYGYEYFPIETGKFVVYDVVDIFHDIVLEPAHDTSRYQIKEVIGEEFIDGEGEQAFKLRRFKRLNDTLSWSIKDVWTIKRTGTTAEVVDENNRKIEMIFAIAYNRSWNDNALNDGSEHECFYDKIYEPFSINDIAFDSSVTAVCENFTSFVDHRVKKAVYAPGIGKIYSVFKDLQIDEFDTTNIQKGPELFYTVADFGIE